MTLLGTSNILEIVSSWQPDTWLHLVEAVGLVVAAILGVRQLRLLREQSEDAHRKEQQRYAIELDAQWESLIEDRQAVDKIFPPPVYAGRAAPEEELARAFAAEPKLEASVRKMIGFFESLALTVCAGATDEDMAFELLCSRLIRYAECFANYIHKRRQEENDNTYYIYHERLAGRWRLRRDNEEGRPPLYLRSKTKRRWWRAA